MADAWIWFNSDRRDADRKNAEEESYISFVQGFYAGVKPILLFSYSACHKVLIRCDCIYYQTNEYVFKNLFP